MTQSIQSLVPTSSSTSESMLTLKQESSLQSQNQHHFQNQERPTESSLSLSKLNNFDLEFGLKKLIHQERKLLHLILLHIKEVDSRKLYLKKAYPSLFEYLTKEHGYSAGSAMRRIEAARLLRDVPQMAKKIQSGEINLSQITEISRAVKEKQRETRRFVSIEEKEDLVLKVVGLNLAKTQKIVSLELNIKPKEYEKKRTQQNESVRLELTLTKAQMEKLNRCKDLTAHIIEQKKMDSSFASVMEVLMDQFLAKRDLSNTELRSGSIKQNKRKNKLDDQASLEDQTCTGNHTDAGVLKVQKSVQENSISKMEIEGKHFSSKIKKERAYFGSKMEIGKAYPVSKMEVNHSISDTHETKAVPEIKVNKTLTLKTKSQIRQRDQCCQYVDPITKKKCGSRFKLEVDHIKPRWANGSNQQSNLQMLCKSHNLYKYKTESGLLF